MISCIPLSKPKLDLTCSCAQVVASPGTVESVRKSLDLQLMPPFNRDHLRDPIPEEPDTASNDQQIREKLAKIEALFADATTTAHPAAPPSG